MCLMQQYTLNEETQMSHYDSYRGNCAKCSQWPHETQY